MSSIIDIFDNLLKYNNKNIFIVFDKNSQIWFKLRDVLKVLGYKNVTRALSRFDINDNFTLAYSKINISNRINLPDNFQKNSRFINEAGLYKLLTNSKKDIANKFKDELFINILPQIRKNGMYVLNNKDNNKIKQQNLIIRDLEQNQKNIVYPEGPSLYIIKKRRNSKTYYKIGYTKNLNRRLRTYNTGEVNKIHFNYFILLENSSIDSCMKKIMKNKEYIKNKEFYKISLRQIIEFIIKCNNKIKFIYCALCLKKYNLDNILLHKC
jgi:prophage antirepressor-like protein/predicted GIY-YIG superfamily endonuclease